MQSEQHMERQCRIGTGGARLGLSQEMGADVTFSALFTWAEKPPGTGEWGVSGGPKMPVPSKEN